MVQLELVVMLTTDISHRLIRFPDCMTCATKTKSFRYNLYHNVSLCVLKQVSDTNVLIEAE